MRGDFYQSAGVSLNVSLVRGNQPPMAVTGDAVLSGKLIVTTGKGFKESPGTSYTILTADTISGEFANTRDEVVTSDGTTFTVRISDTAVTLVVK